MVQVRIKDKYIQVDRMPDGEIRLSPIWANAMLSPLVKYLCQHLISIGEPPEYQVARGLAHFLGGEVGKAIGQFGDPEPEMAKMQR